MIAKSRKFTSNSSRENLRTIIITDFTVCLIFITTSVFLRSSHTGDMRNLTPHLSTVIETFVTMLVLYCFLGCMHLRCENLQPGVVLLRSVKTGKCYLIQSILFASNMNDKATLRTKPVLFICSIEPI